MRPVLTSAWICNKREATMSALIATLNSVDQLTPENTRYLFSKLDQLVVSLDAIADEIDPNFESIGFIVRNLNCLRTVLKNSCPPIDKPDEPGNLKTDAEFLEMLRAISIPLRGLGPKISAKISFVMDKLANLSEVPIKKKAVQPSKENEQIEASDSQKNDRQRLRLEELARISLKLDEIVGQVEAYPDDLICNGVKLGFIKKNLRYLAFVGGTRFTEQAHEAAVNDLTAYYKKLFKYAYSSMRTFGLKGEVSLTALLPLFPEFMKTMSAGFGGSHTRGIAIDDENYPGRLKKWTVTVQAKIDAGFFEAGGKGSLSYGSYEEWDTIRKYVTANIADLANTYSVRPTGIQKYLGGLQHPVVSDYLSRHHILKQAGLKTIWAKWFGADIFRIDRMEVLQQKYADQFERISQSFSVLLSILNTKTAPGSQSEIALQNIDIGDGNGLNLSLRANSVNASGGIGADMPFLKAGGTYSFDRDSTSLDLVVSTPVCEKMADLESEVAEKLTLNKIHRDELESDVSNPFDEIAEKRKRLEQLNSIKLERTNLLQTIRNEIYVKSAGLRRKFDADHATRTLALGNRYEIQTGKSELPWSHQYGAAGIPKSSFEIEVVDLTRKFQSLQRDFQAYLTFQSQLSTAATEHEKASAKAAIKKFHLMYGANDSIDCMVRLISLNAWLYTALGELEQRSSSFPDLAMLIKGSKQSIRDFEVRLNKPTFALDRKKVTELSAFRRRAQLETIDVKHTLKCAGGVTIANAGWSKAQQAGHTDSVLFRHREHPHPMRAGDFRDYEFRFGANVNVSDGMAQSLVTQVLNADHIADIPNLQQCLEKQFGLVSAGEERVFTFRFFKPSQAIFPGLDFRPLYFRKTKVSSHALTPNFAVFTGVTVGGSYEKSTTTFGDEEYSSDSIWNFLLRYFHDYGVGHISETGECSEEGLWLDIATEQRTSLTELFEKFALECASPTRIAPKNSMREELNVIEKAIFRLKISDEARRKIKDARIEFAERTKTFQNSKTAENYNRSLISFQNLMLAYCPHIKKMKRNSPLYRALPFTIPNT